MREMNMASLTLAKIEGIFGSVILLAVSGIFLWILLIIPIPSIITVGYHIGLNVAGIVGNVLIFCAVKRISDSVDDKEIFRNILVWFILQFVVITILFFAIFVFLSRFELTPFRSLYDIFAVPGMVEFNTIFSVLWPLIAVLIATWPALIVSAWFLKRCYERIANRTGTEIFGAVGYWYYWGTRLAIVFVGFIIIMIALILQIMAFYFLPSSIQSREYAGFAIGPKF
jgi:uncharacterized membrane protein